MTPDKSADKLTTEELYQRILAYDLAYRNDTPIVSDAVFDALVEMLRGRDPNHAYFSVVGAAPSVSSPWVKVAHAIPMGSLDKAQTPDEMTKWWPGHPVCITHKCDGISINLSYKNGKLALASTRGDGTVGEDITRNVLLMKGVVKSLPTTVGKCNVRGEVVCLKSDFAVHFPGESNPRNTAAGTAKRQSDAAKCKHLTVVAYQYLPDGVPLSTKAAEITALENLGFTVPAHYLASTPAEVLAVYDEYVASKRAALDYEIDGLVIDVNDRDAREAMGETNQRPKGSVAFKFPHEEKTTTLRAIEWQVGKSGRVTPVAEFDTVKIGGRDISRASLAGVEQVEHLKLFAGCSILVSLRNDVIPRIEFNLDDGIENL